MNPSLRLRLLTFAMRHIVKPRLARMAEPEAAHARFERAAPLLFSTPKRAEQSEEAGMAVMSVGPVHPDRIILYLHGGAFVTGSSRSYRSLAGRLSKRTGVRVAVPEYPLLQQATFPAAPRAVLAAWNSLRHAGYGAGSIALAGDSAGGNLLFGLLSHLLNEGQRPAGVVAFSPWTDLTLSGESLTTYRTIDPIIPVHRMAEVISLYLDGADPAQPLASPLFAEFPKPPPVLIQVGAQEVLRSDAERMAARIGATLEVWPHCPHVWQIFDGRLPEANAAMRAASRFIQTSFESASRNPTASAT